MKKNLILIFCLLSVIGVRAQEDFRLRYGLGASIIFQGHQADFRALPGVPNCCPQFTEGSGTGIGIAGLFEVPLSDLVFIGARLGYMDHSASLEATESTTLIVGNTSTEGTFTHTIDATLGSVGLEPRIGVRLADAVTISAGTRLGTLLSKEYEQKEVASRGTFLDSLNRDTKSAVRNQNSGEIPEASSLIQHLIFSLGYELPLNAEGTTLLVPEVSYALALNDVVKERSWKANALTIGISVKFSPLPPPPKLIVYDTVHVRDTTTKLVTSLEAPRVIFGGTTQEESTIETDVITKRTTIRESYIHEAADPTMLRAHIVAYGLDDEGNELPVAVQRIEEFLQTHAHPLLSFVFFPAGSSTIPDRYVQISKQNAAAYDLRQLFDADDLEVHRNVLNIIGNRLQTYPTATITIKGCNSDHEVEKNNLALSRARAEIVRDYLTTVWGIDPSRVKVEARNLPEVPSSIRSEDGRAENQRVEITSTDPNITDVFTATDTTRVPNPPQLRFRIHRESFSPITSWKLDIVQQRVTIKTFSGEGAPPDSVDWDLANDQKNIPRFMAPLEAKLSVVTDVGEQSSMAALPTEVRTLRQKMLERAADVTIDKFNLVLFHFGKSDITKDHERVLAQVKSKLKPKSQISIEGYTDRTGTSASNQMLAAARATATAQALGRKDAKVVGIGDKRLLFPNDTPEGRFHCRTVQISVRNPIE
jgi:outer membrane protein OmpA-like peptidoglycan-associated protein